MCKFTQNVLSSGYEKSQAKRKREKKTVAHTCALRVGEQGHNLKPENEHIYCVPVVC